MKQITIKEENISENLKGTEPIESAAQCMNMIHSVDMENLSPKDKYMLHMCKEYFKENIESFNDEQINELFERKFFKKNATGKFPEKVLKYHIEKRKVCPILFPVWLTPVMPKKMINEYIEILNENNEKSQLLSFHQKDKSLVSFFYDECINQRKHSDALTEVVCSENPLKILDNNSWDDEKIIKFIKNKPEYIERIVFYFNSSKRKSDNLKKSVLTLGVNTFESDKTILNFLNLDPPYVISLYKEKKPGFLENFFIKKEQKIYSSNKDEINYLQELYSRVKHHPGSKLKSLEFIYESYKDLFLMPSKEIIDLYEHNTDILLYALKNKKWDFFIPFIKYQDDLTNEQKVLHTAACFNYLSFAIEKNPLFDKWIQDSLMILPVEHIKAFYEKSKKSLSNENSILVSKTLLMRKIDTDFQLIETKNENNKFKL